MSTTLGPYHVGEIPPRLTVTFGDSAGNPISLAGFTAKFTYRNYGGAWVTQVATVDGDQVNNKGKAYYTWVAADFATSGDYEAEMWVGNAATQRYASQHFDWQTLPAITPSLTI